MSELQALPNEIRGVMLSVTGGRVLVPSTTMAEVITYVHPAPVEAAPPWLLGRLAWRGWNVPVLAFSVLAGVAAHEPTENSRVAILKALTGHVRLPYFGVLTQGFPRLTLVSEATLLPDGEAEEPPAGVRDRVTIHDEPAWIPDLAAVESLIVGALAAAA
ncbi:MAG: chemotaxis protein CheW [Rhodanobacteraceae bacterium]